MVLDTLLVFNGLLCAAVGAILLVFMSKPAGFVGASIFWTAAAALWQGKRHIERLLPFDGRGARRRPSNR
jgi:hypothetical protein